MAAGRPSARDHAPPAGPPIARLAIYVAEPSSPLDTGIVDRPGVRVVYRPFLCRAAEETFRWLAGAPTGGPVSV